MVGRNVEIFVPVVFRRRRLAIGQVGVEYGSPPTADCAKEEVAGGVMRGG